MEIAYSGEALSLTDRKGAPGPYGQALLLALGAAVAERRSAHRMSQQELADKAGVNRSYLSDVERGLRNITLFTLDSIARSLGTSCSALLAEAEASHKLKSEGTQS
jgi:transcriptional regulator with XRE-family HTH domain